jgi:hypothetical protein
VTLIGVWHFGHFNSFTRCSSCLQYSCKVYKLSSSVFEYLLSKQWVGNSLRSISLYACACVCIVWAYWSSFSNSLNATNNSFSLSSNCFFKLSAFSCSISGFWIWTTNCEKLTLFLLSQLHNFSLSLSVCVCVCLGWLCKTSICSLSLVNAFSSSYNELICRCDMKGEWYIRSL